MARSIPSEIHTGCPELDRVWSEYAKGVLGRPGVLIPDTDDDLTWHAFLGHSVDMQGFRAAEFAGVDPLSRPAPKFRSLRERGLGVPRGRPPVARPTDPGSAPREAGCAALDDTGRPAEARR
jgi:hypothetical protein